MTTKSVFIFLHVCLLFAGSCWLTSCEKEQPFNCVIDVLIDKNGIEYKTVLIGDQCWMAENLKVTHYSDGTPIPLIEDQKAWIDLGFTDKAFTSYENSSLNWEEYGALYTWAAAMNGAVSSNSNPSGVQGVCPTGWHIPSDEEWKELEQYLGMSRTSVDSMYFRGTIQSGMLKEVGTDHWEDPNVGATNLSGFSALPAGNRDYAGYFGGLNIQASFWSATEYVNSPWIRVLHSDYSGIFRYYFEGLYRYGRSVRCVKD